MSRNPNAAIVWDLDGTLIDSARDLATALNSLLQAHGRPGHSVGQVRSMIGDGVTELIRRGFTAAGAGMERDEAEALRPDFMRLYGRIALETTVPMPGALRVLAAMSRQGWAQGVCTNKPSALSRQILAHLGMDEWLGCTVGSDSTDRLKPDPKPVLACLAALGVDPRRALMVGDSGNDLEAAHRAGIAAVLVRSGYGTPPERAESALAAATIDSLDELPALIGELLPGVAG